MGGEDETGLDLGGEEEPEEAAPEPEAPAADEGGGDDILLATPGKRDESVKVQKGDMTTTSKSKGKWYKPVTKAMDKRRHLAPKKKSMKKQYSDRMASSSRENVFPDMNSFSRVSKGIYENIQSTYSKEELKILNSNDEVYKVLEQLEKKDENK